MMICEEARVWCAKYSREVAAKVALEIQVQHLELELAAVRETADEMIREAYSRGMQ